MYLKTNRALVIKKEFGISKKFVTMILMYMYIYRN